VPEQRIHEFSRLLEAWARAIVANDARAIGTFMAPDWVIVAGTGTMTREAFLQLVASGRLTHAAMRFDVQRVDIYGDTAVVTARGTNNGQFEGSPFESDEWVSDVFVRSDGAWLCIHSQLTPAVCA
jgi:uncharacterized protein (TIGR02246 family)